MKVKLMLKEILSILLAYFFLISPNIMYGQEECPFVTNGQLNYHWANQQNGWCENINSSNCGPVAWVASSGSTPGYCAGTNFNSIGMGDWGEGFISTTNVNIDAFNTYKLTFDYYHTTSASNYTFNDLLEINVDGIPFGNLSNLPFDQTNILMEYCHDNQTWNNATVLLDPTVDLSGPIEFFFSSDRPADPEGEASFMYIANICIVQCPTEPNCQMIPNHYLVPTDPNQNGYCENINDNGCGPESWTASAITPGYCVGTNFNSLALGDWGEGVSSLQMTFEANINYEFTFDFFHSSNVANYPYIDMLTINIAGEIFEIEDAPFDANGFLMDNCFDTWQWNTFEPVILNFPVTTQGPINFTFSNDNPLPVDEDQRSYMYISGVSINQCIPQEKCEIITDNNISNDHNITKANNVTVLDDNKYIIAGSLIKEQANNSSLNRDHYFLMRDNLDQELFGDFAGDFNGQRVNWESTLDQVRFGSSVLSVGYSTMQGTGRDIHFARQSINNGSINLTKRIDMHDLHQKARAIDASDNEGASINGIFAVGETNIPNTLKQKMFLLKLDPQGNVLNKYYYGTEQHSYAYDVLINNYVSNPSVVIAGSSANKASALFIDPSSGSILHQYRLTVPNSQYNAMTSQVNNLYMVGHSGNDILLTHYNLANNSIVAVRRYFGGETEMKAKDVKLHDGSLYIVGEKGIDGDKDGFLLQISPIDYSIQNAFETNLPGDEYFESLDFQEEHILMVGNHTVSNNTEMFFVRLELGGENCCMDSTNLNTSAMHKSKTEPFEMGKLPIPSERVYYDRKSHYLNTEICPNSSTETIQDESEFEDRNIHQPYSLLAKIYPIPASNAVTIEALMEKEIMLIEVFSIDGRLINSINTDKAKKIEYDASQLGNGMYLFKITYTDGTELIQRIIIEK